MRILVKSEKVKSKNPERCRIRDFLEAPPGIGPGIRVLQTRALPLGHGAIWSGLRGSNPPPRPWQGRALPNELNPQDILFSAVATRMGLEPTTSSVTG